MNSSKLVSSRRSTVLTLPPQWDFPALTFQFCSPIFVIINFTPGQNSRTWENEVSAEWTGSEYKKTAPPSVRYICLWLLCSLEPTSSHHERKLKKEQWRWLYPQKLLKIFLKHHITINFLKYPSNRTLCKFWSLYHDCLFYKKLALRLLAAILLFHRGKYFFLIFEMV